MRDCPQRSNLTTINKEEAESNSKALKLGLMIFNFMKEKRGCKQKRLMFVGINIVGQRGNALVDMRALFMSKKVVGKLGLTINKMIERIKTVNFKGRE